MSVENNADAIPGGDAPAATQYDHAGTQDAPGSATPTGDGGGTTKEPTRADMEKSALDAILAAEGGRRKSFGATSDDAGPAKSRVAGKDDGKPRSENDEGAATGQADTATPPEVAKAEERVKHTQQKYHEARMEIARLKKQLAKLEDPEQDSRAKPVLDEIASEMSEGAREMLKETPEMREILEKAAQANDKRARTAEIERTKETIAAVEKVTQENEQVLQSEWERAVKSEHPNFLDTLKSVEFLDWKAAHPNLVNSMIIGIDQYDPSGAIKVLNAFRGSRGAKATRREDPSKQSVDVRPGRSHSGVSPTGAPDRQKSIKELESESMAAILQEERAKRRAF